MAVSIALVVSALVGTAVAKLPPPSPEQEQAAAAKKEKGQAQLEQEKRALEKVQNRIAEQYGRPGASSRIRETASRTETTNMPKTTGELPRGAAPRGGTQQSAEAHSAPAK